MLLNYTVVHMMTTKARFQITSWQIKIYIDIDITFILYNICILVNLQSYFKDMSGLILGCFENCTDG